MPLVPNRNSEMSPLIKISNEILCLFWWCLKNIIICADLVQKSREDIQVLLLERENRAIIVGLEDLIFDKRD